MQKVIVRCKKKPKWEFVAYLEEAREDKFIVWTKPDTEKRVEFHFPTETHFFEKAE